jgi:restriction endonuclease S subunit
MIIGVIRHNINDETGFRIDPSFHLSEATTIQSDMGNCPYPITTVSKVSDRIFIGNIFSRNFVQSPEHGVPYLAASDTVLSDIDTGRFLSNKQACELEYLMLKKGWILITCSGTLGNVTYTNSTFENHIATHDLIRIIPGTNKVIRPGVLYAFLASNYGYVQLTQSRFGGVVKHINASHAGNVSIPVFPDSFQRTVDNLIEEAVLLREKASLNLNNAKKILQDFIGIDFKPDNGFRTKSINSKDVIHSLKLRLDPPVYISDSIPVFDSIRDRCIALGDCNVKIWYPGMFKRAYVKHGYPYLQGSAVFETNPFRRCSYLSKTRTPKLSELWLTNGLILISCAGACGQIKLITKEYEDKQAIGSPDIIRLKSSDELFSTGYLFTYLQLPIVYDYLQSLKYGSVIERFDAQHIASIPIVKPTAEINAAISAIIDEYSKQIYIAFCKEQEAISMVEREIESWSKY